jgi:NAD(P)-dependent dehydrogenase (short-subunit alcohol dehydrogenase family)
MPEEKRLTGRVALVTGAAKRLGRVVALRLADEGADLAVHYGRSANEAREVVGEAEKRGRRAASFSAELTSVPAIQKLFDDVAHQFGETSESRWDSSLDTNLKAPFFCSQAAAPHLERSGRGVIINFSDIGGLLGWREYLPHSISKAGIIMMTRVLAKEMAPKVRVNAIAPGTITMPGDPPELEADYIRHTPLGRTGRPEEIADAVVYLIMAEFVTGQVFVLDGGRTL